MDSTMTMLETSDWPEYALLDSGQSRKLERYGPLLIDRPEPQAIWQKKRPSLWKQAKAAFTTKQEEEGTGKWKRDKTLEDQWQMSYDNIRFLCRFSAFRHVGVFPEQAAHWAWLAERTRKSQKPLKILNLFGYTGIASLVAASAGAHVTHVDASKKAISWARENQALSRLENKPIRWICDDAAKFATREGRRQKTYDGIILDPPKYGRGPKGEIWRLEEDLPPLLAACRNILAPKADFLILTTYAIRASFFMLEEIMQDHMAGRGGQLTSGELLLQQKSEGRVLRRLSTSLFTRWENKR